MESDQKYLSDTQQCKRRIRGFGGGWWEIFRRCSHFLMPLLLLIFLAANLGVNNSSNANALPVEVTNCSAASNIATLDIDQIRSSLNVFNGVYVVICSLAIIYQAVMILMKSLDLQLLQDSWKCVYIIELIVMQMLTYLFAGGIVGSYLMTWFWGPWFGAVDDIIESDPRRAASAITGLNWALYGTFIGAFINYFIGQNQVQRYIVIRQYGIKSCSCCNKSDHEQPLNRNI